jgi:hypothetical protein
VSPDGTSVYAATNGDDAVVHFNRNPLTGGLTYAGCIEDRPIDRGCTADADGLNGATDLVVSPTTGTSTSPPRNPTTPASSSTATRPRAR